LDPPGAPTIDWRAFADKFVNEQLGLVRCDIPTLDRE